MGTKLSYGTYKPIKGDKARRYQNDEGKIISVRQFQKEAKKQTAPKVTTKPTTKTSKPTPKTTTKPAIKTSKKAETAVYLPGWRRVTPVKGDPNAPYKSAYYTDGKNNISARQAKNVVDGKKSLKEAINTSRGVDESDPGYGSVKGTTYTSRNIENIKSISRDKDFSEGRLMTAKVKVKSKILYEGESKSGYHWRSISVSAERTYIKDEYWDYVQERAIEWGSDGKIYEIGATFFERNES
jgi:hypothetical protein